MSACVCVCVELMSVCVVTLQWERYLQLACFGGAGILHAD